MSDLSNDEIADLRSKVETGELHPKEAKKRLARELTARFHSPEAAQAAEDNFEKVFQKGGVPDDLAEMRCTASEPIALPQLMVEAGLVNSTSEGRRMIQQGAVTIDGIKASDISMAISPEGEMLIKVGKRRFCKILFG